MPERICRLPLCGASYISTVEPALEVNNTGTLTNQNQPKLYLRTQKKQIICGDIPTAHTKNKTLKMLFNNYNLNFFITGLNLIVIVVFVLFFNVTHEV